MGVIKADYYPGAEWRGTRVLDKYPYGNAGTDIPVYDSTVDPINYVKWNGLLRRPAIGGGWNMTTSCVSRSGASQIFASYGDGGDTTRWCNGNLIILGRIGQHLKIYI